MKWLYLLTGGLLGTLARYVLGGLTQTFLGSDFPYGTLTVNTLGCFLIGCFLILAEEKFMLGPELRLFLMIGFCGAFTTFSTLILESANLMRAGQAMLGFSNIATSVLLGFGALYLGIVLTRSL